MKEYTSESLKVVIGEMDRIAEQHPKAKVLLSKKHKKSPTVRLEIKSMLDGYKYRLMTGAHIDMT